MCRQIAIKLVNFATVKILCFDCNGITFCLLGYQHASDAIASFLRQWNNCYGVPSRRYHIHTSSRQFKKWQLTPKKLVEHGLLLLLRRAGPVKCLDLCI